MLPFYEVTAQDADPLSLADAKAWVKQDSDAEDALITALIAGVVTSAEIYTAVPLRTTTWTSLWAAFPASFCLQKAQVTEIVSIKNTLDDTQHTVSATDYTLDQHKTFSNICPVDGFDWPDVDAVTNPVEVIFKSGFATLPADINTALLQDFAFAYVNRGDAQPVGGWNLSEQARVVLQRYRIRRIG